MPPGRVPRTLTDGRTEIYKADVKQCEGCLLISYNSQLLQEICFQSSAATRHLGAEAGASLHARHSDIQAADNVFELPVGQISIDGNLCTLSDREVLSIVM